MLGFPSDFALISFRFDLEMLPTGLRFPRPFAGPHNGRIWRWGRELPRAVAGGGLRRRASRGIALAEPLLQSKRARPALRNAADPCGEPMTKILPVIMCGGSGTRMWPELRESLPKQFIPLVGERSTFQSIVSLVGDAAVFEPAVVITSSEYRFRVAEQLMEIGAEATILLEAERRDSAAAVGAAAAWAAARDPKTIVAVFAADHVFADSGQFAGLCARAFRRGGRGRNRHLWRHARPSGHRLRLHSSCGGARDDPTSAADREIRREAG